MSFKTRSNLRSDEHISVDFDAGEQRPSSEVTVLEKWISDALGDLRRFDETDDVSVTVGSERMTLTGTVLTQHDRTAVEDFVRLTAGELQLESGLIFRRGCH